MSTLRNTRVPVRPARAVTAAALAAAAALTGAARPATAGTTAPEETVSTSGSTALKNWLVANTQTFTEVQPGTTETVNGVQYPLNAFASAGNPNGILADQLAPKSYQSTSTSTGIVETDPALRFEYHESGSVEGILEMANDQIAPVQYVTQNIDRNPYNGIGNAVWVNYNQVGGKGGAAFSAASGASVNGYTLGNFYANNQTFTLGGTATAAFNGSGGNLNGGQNAVQVALSDAVPVQVFAANAGSGTAASAPWFATPQNAGYGQGNTLLGTAALGTPGSRQVYQSTAALNMPATAINPRTTDAAGNGGTTFGTGPWNTAGLGNLTSQTVATTATLFVANPGTGLTGVDRTDAQWLQTTGRLRNGAVFNMTTRDVNSGTRNVAALETGLDPTYAVGANDDGNGNALNGATDQVTVGPGLRFSNKTAGGNELRPTVQANRMAVGTLSINDASGTTINTAANPLRALRYSDSADGSAPYVLANYYTIAGVTDPTNNPNGQQYTIFQNEQFVTLKAPGATYAGASPAIQGDNAAGDVKGLLNNTLGSVAAYNGSSPASPAAGLLNQGYIVPQLDAVTKAQNGLNVAGTVSAIVANPAYNTANGSALTSLAVSSGLVGKLASGDPASVTTGSASTVYGGSSAGATGPAGFNGQVPITAANELFGNFNQTGVRDYDAVVVQAQRAQAALAASGAGTSGFTADGGSANSTHVTTGVAALDAANSGAGVTKGDLIALGDFNGDGKFNGLDLYQLAVGASLSDAANRPTETTAGGTTTFTTGHVNATAATFGSAIATSVLNKNTALDYLQANATAQQKADARAVLEVTSAAAAIPAGATAAGTDDASGFAQYTFDPAGANAFNKSDVNRDGTVDFNDAVLVDKFNGQDYTNLGNAVTATEQAPVTGTVQPANLVLASQTDASTTIGSADLAVMNTALTGTGNTNWYAYALAKTGPGTIAYARTGGTVTVFGGAAFNVAAGRVTVGGVTDPFTDSTATGLDTTKSVAVTVGATLEYAAAATGSIRLARLASLSVPAGGLVRLDPSATPASRTLLAVGGLSLTGGTLDLGNNDLVVHNASLSAVTALAAAGYAGGAWTGAGLTSSSAAADAKHLTAVGVIAARAGTFDGQAVVATDVLARYTYYGDTNLSGVVDAADYLAVDAGYYNHLTGWANGDFNYDGVVDGSDYTLMDNAFDMESTTLVGSPAAELAVDLAAAPAGALAGTGRVATPAAELAGGGAAAVPEPGTLGLLAAAAGLSLSGRRRRRRA